MRTWINIHCWSRPRDQDTPGSSILTPEGSLVRYSLPAAPPTLHNGPSLLSTGLWDSEMNQAQSCPQDPRPALHTLTWHSRVSHLCHQKVEDTRESSHGGMAPPYKGGSFIQKKGQSSGTRHSVEEP